MSGFDENPFGEPTVDDPFADPAVTKVTQTSKAHKGLEDYNPFEDQPPQRNVPPVRGAANPPFQPPSSSQPAIMQPTQEMNPPPSYARSAQMTQPPQPAQLSTAEFQRRQEELDRKAAELARREEELKNASYNVRRNNWPPLPENNMCGIQPCFYQDINVEIPSEFQAIVQNLYYLWMFHAALMLLNVLGGLLLMFQGADFHTFPVGVIYAIIFTPFSFICWFRPAYKAFRSDSSFNFMVFFFIFFFQMVITIFQAIGTPGSGTCGLVTALKTLTEGTPSGIVVGIFLLLVAAGFCCAAFIDFLLLTKVHRIYRSTGASFAKAQQEFTSEIMRNQVVRDAAGNVVSAAVQSQFNQQSPSSRY